MSAVIVVGVHRSGTSAVAGALAQLGYYPGDRLLPAVEGVNTSGFFEDERVVAINDAALKALHRDWRVPLPLPANWLSHTAIEALRPRIRDLLIDFGTHSSWLIKDPRLCQLLPMWQAEMRSLGIEPRVLLMYRSPGEVAKSLTQRDQLGWVAGQHLWARNLLDAERHTRQLPRKLVRYADLVEQPQVQLNAIANWLGDVPAGAPDIATAAQFVCANHRHHRDADTDAALLPIVAQLANVFSQASDLPFEGLDAISDQFAAAFATYGTLIESQWRATTHLEGEFEQALAQLDAKEANAQALVTASQTNAEAARAASASATEAMRQIAAKDASIETLQTQLSAMRARALRVLGEQTLQPNDASTEPSNNAYRGSIDLAVENNSHTRVVRYIRESVSTQNARILEVGCSAGYLGESLGALGHEVWGIETNSGAVLEARKKLAFVYAGTIEAFLLDVAHEDVRFDFILFGDVLEHLLDPARVLRACIDRLSGRGAIIASVPNVAHERVRLMLLEGRWEYTATGIMDNTHLHFFTRDSLIELMTRVGLGVKRLSAITLTDDAVGINVNPRMVQALREWMTDREKDVFQFVLMARPAVNAAAINAEFSLRTLQRILCLPPLPDSSLYSIRLGDPLERYIQLYGGEVRVASQYGCTAEDIAWAETVIFQREASDPILELVRRLRRMGKRVVFDIDDYLLDVPEYLAVHAHCKAMRPLLEVLLAEVDAVSTSTQPLREQLLPYNPNVFVTPNCAWSSNSPIKHTDTGSIRIIVASSDSVRVDFLVTALKEIQANPQLNVEIVGIGPPGVLLREAGIELDHAENMSHEQFKAYLASRDNTIALIPLDDNEFNRSKSAVKFFDYALAGVPCICSQVTPYTAVIDDPDNGILCLDNKDAWVRAIEVLVRGAQRRQDTAAAARQRCEAHHNLNFTAAAWQEMLVATRFPDCDPLYADQAFNPQQRTPLQLMQGTLRHLLKPASYASALQILRTEGLKGLRAKWKLVF